MVSNDVIPADQLKLLDARVFAEEVTKELTQAREHGGTLVHNLFDQAAGLAVDKYCHWIERSPQPNLELWRASSGYPPMKK
ncbi:hypothetical protein [Aeromonas dhakensis]|uniref:hypothetical protein n=1 Tax=Aeromonas dhakensis TaxID=196024 RepID=UPI0038CF43CD